MISLCHHPVYSRNSRHVSQLMGVGHHGGCPVRDDGSREFSGGEHAALYMNMGVNQPGGDHGPLPVQNFPGGSSAPPGDSALRDGENPLANLGCNGVEQSDIFYQEVGGFPPR